MINENSPSAQMPVPSLEADTSKTLKDHRPTLEASEVIDIPDRVTTALTQLTQNPKDRQALTHLNQTRRSLADYLLRHPLDRLQTEWNQDLHKAYRAVWNSGLKNSPPDDADRAFIEQIATQASGDPRDSQTFQALLVA
ncbi:MAG: hypothetical protein HC799_20100, partial [Limnothrix sp. RL_2_0]|nr:hypothetical protein [Limnothrix sp. RL_2_0]